MADTRIKRWRRLDQPGHELVTLTVHADGSALLRGTTIFADDGEPIPVVEGCEDVDLSVTPATNLLPIRRLALPIGASSPVRAAWLRFPELTVEVLDQTYHRIGERRYAYESGHGAFRAELEVDEDGLVVHYPNLWKAE